MSKYTLKEFGTQMMDGLFAKNPVLVQMLGMCSALAVTTSVTNALGMGLAMTAVLICSNIFISLLRHFIPKQIRIAAYIVIISGFVTAVQLLMQAFLNDLYKSLGLFIPLIVVNCIILARAESFASKQPVLPSAVDGLAMGVGYTFALTVLAAVRELLGAGTLCGVKIMPDAYEPAIIFILPSGAFLTLGFLIALMNKLMDVQKEHAAKKAAAVPAAEAAEPAEETANEESADESVETPEPQPAETEPAAQEPEQKKEEN
ncbi:MAG: electron transport complex subunit E [Clostridia bacterium]|nr:electron transport complex subunit E [Clostridia bacterium]